MFGCSVFLFHLMGASFTVFVALFLWPDLFMLGYLTNAKLGARLYNLVHSDALSLALASAFFGLRPSGLLAFALIWLAHIGDSGGGSSRAVLAERQSDSPLSESAIAT
jgi:hypothetical protein